MTNLKTGEEFSASEFQRALAERAAILKADPTKQQEYAELTEKIKRGIADVNDLDLAGSANATVGGMMRNVGARQAAMFGGGWKNPYITDGLVAMWDGEWNSKDLEHKNRITTWVDCVSKISAYSDNEFLANDKSIVFNGYSFTFTNERIKDLYLSKKLALEYTYSYSIVSPNQSVFCCSNYELFPGWSYSNRSDKLSCFGGSFSRGWSTDKNNVSLSFAIDGTCQLYLDSVNVSSASVGSSTYVTDHWYIGQLGSFTSKFKGNIYNIRLYNRTLSQEEVKHNYQVDKDRFNLP